MQDEAQRFIAERQHLVHVALGDVPADRVINSACLLNTYSGEWLQDTAIAIVGDRIARIGDCQASIGPDTEVIDAAGLYAVPGLSTRIITSRARCSPHGVMPKRPCLWG